LNTAIAISLKRDPKNPKSQFVRSIILVKGVHFYGFHSSYAPFLKVYIVDPGTVTRSVAVLQSGSVMSTKFRIYESHLGYILQFLADFGLYGCGWLEAQHVLQRHKHAADQEELDMLQFPGSPCPRQSRMPLEVDAFAHDILNRRRILPRNLHDRLTIPTPPLPPEPLVVSVRELWDDERQRRAARGLAPSPDMPVDPSASTRGVGGDWSAETRWWDELRRKIETGMSEPFLEAPPAKWEGQVMSTVESVEALWEKPFRTWKPIKAQEDSEVVDQTHEQDSMRTEERTDFDVDVSILHSQEISFTNVMQDVEQPENDRQQAKLDAEQEADDELFDEDEYLRDLDSPPPREDVIIDPLGYVLCSFFPVLVMRDIE
jgi:DNA polymerase zeta